MGKQRKNILNTRKKNRRKAVRTVLQIIVLLVVCSWIVRSTLTIHHYVEPDRAAWQHDGGFIALSYFGVGRNETAKLVDNDLLDKHLSALHQQGYVTISQQDILDYVLKGAPLPDKALFLVFEDGRNDTALLAQPILEKLNYKATMMTYADKMGSGERKFLQPKDLRKMMKSGYWELGSNGYRMSYINIFDNDGRYLGVMDDRELKETVSLNNVAYYNHYLMDFIRDEHMIPAENRDEMFARIDRDYELMEERYVREFGEVPKVYMIMHANSLYGGMHPLVEEANVRNIERLFAMHFNREGNAFNERGVNRYDLTRLQVAPYWSTNHLLMKIQQDSAQPVQFVEGDAQRFNRWKLASGAAEFTGSRIILTSPPQESGLLVLKQSDDLKDVHIRTQLTGNVVGEQAVLLRYDAAANRYVKVSVRDNWLRIEQQTGSGQEELMYEQELSEVNWRPEDLALDKASVYTRDQTAAEAEKPYEDDTYPVHIRGDRALEISLLANELTVKIDGDLLVDRLSVADRLQAGAVALSARYSSQLDDHEEVEDGIYDAIFDHLTIEQLGQAVLGDTSLGGSAAGGADDEQAQQRIVLYESDLTMMEAIRQEATQQFHALIDWAIDVF